MLYKDENCEWQLKVSDILSEETLEKGYKMKPSKNYKKYKKPYRVEKFQADIELATATFLREQLELSCLSYRKLAALTGVNYNIISQTCNGELPQYDTFKKICEAFVISEKEIKEIYETALKESLIIRYTREQEYYKRVERNRAGGKKIKEGCKSNENKKGKK